MVPIDEAGQTLHHDTEERIECGELSVGRGRTSAAATSSSARRSAPSATRFSGVTFFRLAVVGLQDDDVDVAACSLRT